jgi:C-terminal processing protease CtpA/Prc
MVEPMRDGHIWFTAPNGTSLRTHTPEYPSNFNQAVWSSYLPRMGWHQVAPNLGYGFFEDIAYVAIGSWNPAHFTVDQADEVLEVIRPRRALILDVRPNGGGNDQLAFAVAARFAATTRTVELVRFRNGPGHGDFGPLIERQVAPRGPWRYDKRVYLLIGRGCFSSNESFVLALRGLPQVTVVGDTTGGSSGNPGTFALIGGWSYTVPRWIAYTVDQEPIEWKGIAPDLYVPFRAEDVTADIDPVIEAALALARQATTSVSRSSAAPTMPASSWPGPGWPPRD